MSEQVPQVSIAEYVGMSSLQIDRAMAEGRLADVQAYLNGPAVPEAPTAGMSPQEIVQAVKSGALGDYLGERTGEYEPIRVGPNRVAVENFRIPWDIEAGAPVEQWGEDDLHGLSSGEVAAAVRAGHLVLHFAGLPVDQVDGEEFARMSDEERRQADRDDRLALLRAGHPVPPRRAKVPKA
ncbi:hypothetical protein ACFYNZ_15300 [Streptomyces kebangsaanensis]|uniref:Uncharacterized protein n=1 Tax=Streptomyces kebangsaanensis TaxID=864058 RepID=A0ABW6KTX8_9ACTN